MANVSVRAVDDGGTAGGGADTSAPQSFTITIVNRPPVANADAPSVLENDVAGVTFDVLANDTDPESDPLAVASYDDSTIANGGLTDNGGGSFTYVPATHFAGTDTFSYTVSDGARQHGHGGRHDHGHAPCPTRRRQRDDAFLTPQDTPLVQAAPGRARERRRCRRQGRWWSTPTPVVAPASGAS